jgi:hypothetical protein
MIVQLWTADYVPSIVPDFVDKHITVDFNPFTQKDEYIFEINPNHPVFAKTKNVQKAVMPWLRQLGFKRPKHFYTGEKPKALENHSHSPMQTDMHGFLNVN